MRFDFQNRVIYINLKNVSSVSVSEDKDWHTKEKVYHTEICVNGMMTRVATTSTEAEANDLVQRIGEALEKIEPEKTYLDGFKDGTEYALKLINIKG